MAYPVRTRQIGESILPSDGRGVRRRVQQHDMRDGYVVLYEAMEGFGSMKCG
jgi:hypothetical protein